jgi:lipoprotein-anchoring transpeptidase ErfK/SrfK
VFGGVLYIPPIGTRNRRVEGTLGKYRVDLGDGIGLHGTLDKQSIGKAVTHGCVRLHDGDIEWLFRNIAVGTRVTIR